MISISLNGEFYAASTPVITADNSSFQYGEGIFETMAVIDGIILLQQYHMQRTQAGLELLGIDFSPQELHAISHHILQLCAKNNCVNRARVRVAFFRRADNRLGYLIQANPLPAGIEDWNETGWSIDLYPAAQKSIDRFSNAKTASYLPYSSASRFATANNLDEVIVLNAKGNVCDCGKTNIFLVRNGRISTPSLSEGCIAGVYRRYLIEALSGQGIKVYEPPVLVEDLENADEIFCTNAIRRIKWVATFRGKSYQSNFSQQLARLL